MMNRSCKKHGTNRFYETSTVLHFPVMGCPRTPAPVRNASFLMSAAAVLETPTLLRKPSPTNANSSGYNGKENSMSCGTPAAVLQPPSAASTAAMQFLMFNQQRSMVEKAGMVSC